MEEIHILQLGEEDWNKVYTLPEWVQLDHAVHFGEKSEKQKKERTYDFISVGLILCWARGLLPSLVCIPSKILLDCHESSVIQILTVLLTINFNKEALVRH